jgi:thiol-disulfide isomerase/thioredoxin
MFSRRLLVGLILGCTFAFTQQVSAAAPKPYDQATFDAAQRAGQPILIAVHAPWCPTCKAQVPILGELTDEPKFKSLAYFIVDFDTQKDLLRRLGVRTQSTLIAFKGSEERGRSVGDTSASSIGALVNKTL